jgi:hypothetical protein
VTKWYDAPSTSVHSPKKGGQIRRSASFTSSLTNNFPLAGGRSRPPGLGRYELDIKSVPFLHAAPPFYIYLHTQQQRNSFNQAPLFSENHSPLQTLHFIQYTYNLPSNQKKKNGTHHTPPPHPLPTPHPLSLHPRPLHRANRRAPPILAPPSKSRESRLGEAIQTRGRCCHVVSFLLSRTYIVKYRWLIIKSNLIAISPPSDSSSDGR